MKYGLASCEKKRHSQHQTLFHLSERVWEEVTTGRLGYAVV